MIRLIAQDQRVQARQAAMAQGACARIPEQGIPGGYRTAVYAWLLPRHDAHWAQVALGTVAPAPGYIQIRGDDFRGLSRSAAVSRVRGMMLGLQQIRPASEQSLDESPFQLGAILTMVHDGQTVLALLDELPKKQDAERELLPGHSLSSIVPVVLSEREILDGVYRDDLVRWAATPATEFLWKPRAAMPRGDGIAQLKELAATHSSQPR